MRGAFEFARKLRALPKLDAFAQIFASQNDCCACGVR